MLMLRQSLGGPRPSSHQDYFRILGIEKCQLHIHDPAVTGISYTLTVIDIIMITSRKMYIIGN